MAHRPPQPSIFVVTLSSSLPKLQVPSECNLTQHSENSMELHSAITKSWMNLKI